MLVLSHPASLISPAFPFMLSLFLVLLPFCCLVLHTQYSSFVLLCFLQYGAPQTPQTSLPLKEYPLTFFPLPLLSDPVATTLSSWILQISSHSSSVTIGGRAFFTYTHSSLGSFIVCLLSKSCRSLLIIIVPTFLQSYTNLGISIGFHSFPTVFLYPASFNSLAICVEPFLAIIPSHMSRLIFACSGLI